MTTERAIWRGSHDVVYRVGVFGDFLPCFDDRPPTSWTEPAERLAPLLEGVDLCAVNLELPLAVEGLMSVPKSGRGYNLRAPAAAADYLAVAGLAVVGLANNHSYDYGEQGVEATRAVLRERGLRPLGAGRTAAEPPEIVVVDGPGDVRVGFWAAANNTLEPSGRRERGVEPATAARGRQAAAALASAGATCRIALVHAGLEHTSRPDPADVKLLHALAAEGFDLVAACHSHRVSGHSRVQRPGGGPAFCFHGLGSVVSTVAYSALEREGAMAVLGLDADGRPAECGWRPVVLDERGWGSAAEGAEADQIAARFDAVTRELADGSYAREFYRDVRPGLLRGQLHDFSTAWRNAGARGVGRKIGRMRPRHLRRLANAARVGR